MFRFFWQKPASDDPYQALIEEIVERVKPYDYSNNVRSLAEVQQLARLSPGQRREFVLAAIAWLENHLKPDFDVRVLRVRSVMFEVLERPLPLVEEDLQALLNLLLLQSQYIWRELAQLTGLLKRYLKEHPLTPQLQKTIEMVAALADTGYSNANIRKKVTHLREVLPVDDQLIPLQAGEAWADAALVDLEGLEPPARQAWNELLNACHEASGSTPTAKWLRSAQPLLERVGSDGFREAVVKWFRLVDKPRNTAIDSWSPWRPDPNLMIDPANADVLKGLAWLCARSEDPAIARALTALALSAYRKVPGVGPRCSRVGNACVWALGNTPGSEGIGQLALLKLRVKVPSTQKVIEKALEAAAERVSLSPGEIEEMAVPVYGLEQVGLRQEVLGDITAQITVTGTHSVELTWMRLDGKSLAAAPKVVKEQHPEAVKELAQAVKDLRKMLPAQRARLESLYLAQRQWSLPAWRERYLDQPLVGTLARRLIWKFSRSDQAASGIWSDGRIVGRDDRPLDWLDENTRVELWHPLSVSPEAVMEWRDWLAEHAVQQPFKQAHREIYLLTEAERQTQFYSNRFAAHIIKQHQFNALCGERGWKNKLRLMVDDECPPATLLLPTWGLRAEFWVEAIGENYGMDTTSSGTYLYLTTDQVRFYPIQAQKNLSHVMGGGYYTGSFGQHPPQEPVLLEDIPPLVLSEVLRDVDLFVGVASVGNDANWIDSGPGGRYQDYWSSYSFGDLQETAKTRKQVLEKILPRLKIAGRCRLTERFLVVKGDLRTYKIHLGSGNILMEPNDQYLCIVPSQKTASRDLGGKIFLPFEGDRTLAVILSKAFLLADDRKIKDPTIISQINRKN